MWPSDSRHTYVNVVEAEPHTRPEFLSAHGEPRAGRQPHSRYFFCGSSSLSPLR